ncbi:nucleoside hydrolase [Mesorhizobium sp. RP14(2022)]|uniref:Nucleoside hydrolase n=1 Tax=Mesorhizobium liriopis TaxID=2953882 RepID=A0ABT1CCG4_9HYPH|nr:nucleoside hydrolase [Mesorhizobium liriopis]MCO6052193.1 nucleoside hydrolase [Mesorhizobium liriopis]
MNLRIIHDCDPGNDDALAILVASGHSGLELAAVTTGAGHLEAHRTARNAAITLSYARPVPVSAGAVGPLVRERLVAGVLDQTSALDPERPDLPAVPLDPRHSVELMADTLKAANKTTIVCTGPFTNLAMLLRAYPDLASRIERVVSLGGAWGLGNKTAAAEWNMLCDPEAAAVVFGSGVPIRLVPLDVTPELGIDADLAGEVESMGGPMAGFAAELLHSLVLTFRPGLLGPTLMPLNDPVAPLLAAEPALARWAPARVEVELAGRHTYGRTVVDFACRAGMPANCEVAIGLDPRALRRAFLDALRRLASSSSNSETPS